MIRHNGRRWWRLVAAFMIVALPSCRSKPAPVEELFSTRMLGLSYLQRNRLPEAEAQFKKLIELAPNDPLGYTNLGLAYLQAGNAGQAVQHLRRYLRGAPGASDRQLIEKRIEQLSGR